MQTVINVSYYFMKGFLLIFNELHLLCVSVFFWKFMTKFIKKITYIKEYTNIEVAIEEKNIAF